MSCGGTGESFNSGLEIFFLLNRACWGSYGSWKTWRVMEFCTGNFHFQAWKVLVFNCGSLKVIENDVYGKNYYKSILLVNKKGRR